MNQLEQSNVPKIIENVVMIRFIESVALSITKWCSPYLALHFSYSCVIYQHQYLGLHSNQMMKPTSNPMIDLTMVNFWLLGYAGE